MIVKENKHFIEGTTHVTYLHKNDENRHKSYCIYLKFDGICSMMVSKCVGSAHCKYYTEQSLKKQENKDAVNDYDDWIETNILSDCEKIDIDCIDLSAFRIKDKQILARQIKTKLQSSAVFNKELLKPISLHEKEGCYFLDSGDYNSFVKICCAKKIGKTQVMAQIYKKEKLRN